MSESNIFPKGSENQNIVTKFFLTDHPSLPQFSSRQPLTLNPAVNSIQFNSILYSDCQIHFSASTKHVIKGHQTITNDTLNLGGFDSANWPTRM